MQRFSIATFVTHYTMSCHVGILQASEVLTCFTGNKLLIERFPSKALFERRTDLCWTGFSTFPSRYDHLLTRIQQTLSDSRSALERR